MGPRRFQCHLSSVIAGFLTASVLLGIQFFVSEEREVTKDTILNDRETFYYVVVANYGWPIKCVSLYFAENVTWRVHSYILTTEEGASLHGDYPVAADGTRLEQYNLADAISREKTWPTIEADEATTDVWKLIADGAICALIVLIISSVAEWLTRRLAARRKKRLPLTT